jgi:hypothetical protein
VYLRPTTLRGYREHVYCYLLPYLGHHTLAELGTRDVQQMLRGLAGQRDCDGGQRLSQRRGTPHRCADHCWRDRYASPGRRSWR